VRKPSSCGLGWCGVSQGIGGDTACSQITVGNLVIIIGIAFYYSAKHTTTHK